MEKDNPVEAFEKYVNSFLLFEFNFLVVLHNSRKKFSIRPQTDMRFFQIHLWITYVDKSHSFPSPSTTIFYIFFCKQKWNKKTWKFISKLLSGGGFLLGLKICGGLLELLLQLDTVGLHVNKSFPQRWLENK